VHGGGRRPVLKKLGPKKEEKKIKDEKGGHGWAD
jgi:hypothetical protein